eukprot:TRINITY_DN9567_c0_g3_i1.p1 TRINITY_DN9567_c0_g3~~TRINITY_DN9567_c0_g3_i1.p1  ORF type:complete len:158 (+),score=30.01 TRINITY_DN9567_c0_g3_i1:354-827(+)
MTDKLAPTKRFRVVHNDKTLYEWDQTIEEVNMFIPLPVGLPSRQLSVEIKRKHLRLGAKGNQPYLDHDLGGGVKADASFWTVEDGVLHVTLQKAERAIAWKGALVGHEIQEYDADQEKRRLMLERFQDEHAGFDFSGAEMSGTCPDPSTFLGGPRNV